MILHCLFQVFQKIKKEMFRDLLEIKIEKKVFRKNGNREFRCRNDWFGFSFSLFQGLSKCSQKIQDIIILICIFK